LVFFHLSPLLRGTAGQFQIADSITPETQQTPTMKLHSLLFNNSFRDESIYPLCNVSNAHILLCTEIINRSDGKGGVVFDVIFGPAYKGISLGAVVCSALYNDYGVNIGFAYNRKEAKDHGEGGTLVGASMSGGKRVLVVDDVITAGTAIRESHTMLQSIGAEMVGVVIALDRAEKRSLEDPVSAVQAVHRDLSVSTISIVNLPQLQVFLERSSIYGDDVLKSVRDYRTEYGV